MFTDREFVLLTATGSRPSAWFRVWLTVAAVAAGAFLLWLGLILALAVVVAATLVLLPVWAWQSFAAARRPEGPATLEGEYTIITLSSAQATDEVPGRKPTGDTGRPEPSQYA